MSKTKSAASGSKDKKVPLSVSISQDEMRRLDRRAKRSGLDRSKYVRTLLFGSNESKQNLGMVGRCVTLCQDILNIVQEKYSCEDNSLLKEKVKKLWEALSSNM